MAEPSASDIFGWAGTVASSVIAAIGSVIAWLRGMKKAMEDRIAQIERVQNSQAMDLAVLRTEQKNSQERVKDIQEMVRDGNCKLDEMREQLTTMYLELRNRQ